MFRKALINIVLIVSGYVTATGMAAAQEKTAVPPLPDFNKYRLTPYDEHFFKGVTANGEGALAYWMQSANWRGNPQGDPERFSLFERLVKGDRLQLESVNKEIQEECRAALADIVSWVDKNSHRRAIIWIELALRVPDRLTSKTHQMIRQALKALDIARPESYYMKWIGSPGSNGSNVHGYLTPLALAPALISDAKVSAAGGQGLRSELAHMNNTGDMTEFNLLESHWNGTSSWELIKQYTPDPHHKRMARMIAERIWINRFLTWSAAVERITGPGSRMAPNEWLGTDNERALFATGLSKPVWLNFFFPWDGWDPRKERQIWEQTQLEATIPVLPSYLQDIAWRKTYPNQLQARVALKHWKPYPVLDGMLQGDPLRPAKYVNYQTENYTLGSTTSSWVVNTCVVAASAWWNNSRNPEAPLGSPERFCVLYPHYVFNGMSFLDKGELYFENAPDEPVRDSKGGPGGPWIREFIDFGRVGTLQDRNALLLSYTAKPGTHHSDQSLVKTKVQRASAAMFLFRWTEGTAGLFVNREPVKSLPYELKPGDWWFIEDGEVYAAVRPLEATCLKGDCRTVLEKRTRHIVLYQDNLRAENSEGISDEEWVKARSGFIVEMGDKKEYGSFSAFQDKILAGKVTNDEGENFTRRIDYQRADRRLEMDWHCYTEAYAKRRINTKDDTWPDFLESPGFSVGNGGAANVQDASVKTATGEAVWLLSGKSSGNWVAYQPNPDKVLPVDFKTPAGRFVAERFPFGKIVIHKASEESVKVTIDASYLSESSTKDALLELHTAAGVKNVSLSINGLKYNPRKSSSENGAGVWTVDPNERARDLKKTMLP